MNRPLVLYLLFVVAGCANAFNVNKPLQKISPSTSLLFSKKKTSEDTPQQLAFPIGTFVEFEEKKREHIGKISQIEHKSNGSARYQVIDSEGKHYEIADKAVHFVMYPPNSPGAASKLFDEFVKAQCASEEDLQTKLDISPEYLEIAWEESNASEDSILTADQLVELVHSHAASAIEQYMAWKLLKMETGHLFFKEIKDHGRVVSFKAKAKNAVEGAKQVFCNSHQNSDLCIV
jgi:hypothetical protein